MTFLFGLVALALAWWLLKTYTKASPAALARILRRVGGGVGLLVAAVLLLRGRLDMAMFVGIGAASLLGWGGFSIPGMTWSGQPKRPGPVSRMRSRFIAMELDEASGAMRGSVLAGSLAGRSLADLDVPSLQRLYGECLAADPDGLRLLEAYLDRRLPGWREDAQRDPHLGAGRKPQSGAMTDEEAYQVLGLQPGAGPEEVRRAHRSLMKKLHPDQGGSTYLASRVNQAKDVLLNQHR